MSIIWVHISAHIVDLDKLTMERLEQIDDGETRVTTVFVLMGMKESFAK